jgi:hemerythrin
LGIPLIDQQHKEYLGMVNRLLDMCEKEDVDEAAVKRELEGLSQYMIEHFDAEEHLMRGMDYPQIEAHMAKHEEFRKSADEFLSGPEHEWTARRTQKLARWLCDWFYEQVKQDDSALARHWHAVRAGGEQENAECRFDRSPEPQTSRGDVSLPQRRIVDAC